MAILEVRNIEKHFGKTNVLQNVSFSMEEGNALAIIGSSGSGKTTLLRCLNFLEKPNAGQIIVNGKTLFDSAVTTKEKDAELRKKRLHFGMVFQQFNLFPQYTALENVTLSEKLLAQQRPDFKKNKKEILSEINEHGKELLDRMGLAERMEHSFDRCLCSVYSLRNTDVPGDRECENKFCVVFLCWKFFEGAVHPGRC